MQVSMGNAQVMRMLATSAPHIQRLPGNLHGGEPGELPHAVISAIRSSDGQPLERNAREPMEVAFGADFGGVRVHTGPLAERAARDIHARAFTVGQDIYFASGQYRPGTQDGDRLLAHELTHTAQQRDIGGLPRTASVISQPGDPLEREAHDAADGKTGITRRGLAPMIAREPEGGNSELTDFPYQIDEFIVHFAVEIKRDLRAEMDQVSLPTGSRLISWAGGRDDLFIHAVLAILLAGTGKDFRTDLYRYLTPSAVFKAVSRGREVGDFQSKWLGGKDYFPAVATEIRSVLSQQVAASLLRIAPRYLLARNQAALADPRHARGPAPLRPEPRESDIVPSAPIDRLVIPALLSGTVTVDLDAYRAANPRERSRHQIQRIRTINEGDWRFEAVQGLWSWIRVSHPQDATIEEVAALLYGDETKSHLIVPAPPFFGFDPDRIHGTMRERWQKLAGEDEDDTRYRVLKGVPTPKPGERETTLQHGYSVDRSAVVELLYSTQADEVALIQARKAKPTGAARPEIVSRLTLCLKLLDYAAADAKRFHLDFEPARTRLQERLKAVAALADPRLAYRWDAQSAGQLDILQRAMAGLRVTAARYQAVAAQAPTPEPVGGTSPYTLLVAPIVELGTAYVEVARISELLETAGRMLGDVDQRSAQLPFDLAEARLAMMRQTLAHMTTDKLHPGQRYTPAQLAQKGYADLSREEMTLRRQLATAREKLASDPGAALGELVKLDTSLRRTELGVQLGDAIERLIELLLAVSGQMRESGGLGAIFTGGDYKVEMARVLRWARRWENLYSRYRKGEAGTAGFKQDLKDLSLDPDWKELFESVLSRLSDLAQREAWINFGAKIAALIAIAVVTAGAGAIAEGAGLGAWSVAGVEALTFTTLTLPFEDKPSVQGFFLHVAENWVTFGLVKGANALYEAAVSEKFAATLLGKGASGLVNFATSTTMMIAQAEAENLAHNGEPLSVGDVKGIIGQSTALTLANLLVMRYTRPFMTELHRRGEAFSGEIDMVNALRAKNLALAEAVKETKSSELAKALADADARQAELEGEILRKLAHDGTAAKDGSGHSLSPDQQQVVAALTEGKAGQPSRLALDLAEQADVARARTLVELEPVSSELFLAEPGKDMHGYAKTFTEAGAEVLGPTSNPDGSQSVIVDFHDGHPFEVMGRASNAGLITRPAEVRPSPAAAEQAPATEKSAAEIAPEIEAAQERAEDAARDAEHAQAEQVKHASTRMSLEDRRPLIKAEGERLKAAASREHAARADEKAKLEKHMDRLRRAIADYGNKKKGASSQQKERLNKKIRKLATELYQLDSRARDVGSELTRLNEARGLAERMIKGSEIDTLPCFPPGTLVWTAGGTSPIEGLAAGLPVRCWDEEREAKHLGEITKVHQNRTSWLFRITTGAGWVDATGGHRFFEKGGGWTAAREIRAGMLLRAHDGWLLVQGVTLEPCETATHNLSVSPFPTFFVGPGLLVHNAAAFHLGNFVIYEGYNDVYPDRIYIGKTDDLRAREAAHNAEGRNGLKKNFLTEEERLFYEFKAGMKLRPRLTGLDKLTAQYFEQTNKDWEASVRGDDKVMNRIEVVAAENWPDVVRRVTELFC